MPAKQFEADGNQGVEVLLISDDDIPKITGQPENVIVLTKSLVRQGAMVAKRYVEVRRLDADLFEMPTYQERKAKVEELNSLLDDSNRREIELATQIEGIKKKYAAEMDSLDKSQHEIRILNEEITELNGQLDTTSKQWWDCKASCKCLERKILRLKNHLIELEAAQLESAAQLNGQLDTATDELASVNQQWENSKAHAKRLERDIDLLTDLTGAPLYLCESKRLESIVRMSRFRRLLAVFTGFGRPKLGI